MTVTQSTMLSRSDRVLAADIGGEIAMIDLDAGRYFGFDAIGSRIWEGLEQPTTCAALCALMAQAFDGDDAVIARDVTAFVDRLVERRLVVAIA